MASINHLDLFSGIGGFAYAVDQVWPGSTHTFCDNNLFCQKVLAKHWPESTIYGDIREVLKIWENYAHTVKTKSEPAIQTGGKSVSQRLLEIDYMEALRDTKNTSKELEKQPEGLGLWSTRLMEGSVPVVASQNHVSWQSTILTEAEPKKENDLWGCNSTDTSKTTTSPKNTNFSVTTAIMENIDLGGVHTKYDLLTAGVPCQPASTAGKRRGTADDRWLWPETFTAIELTKPNWVILENVRGLLTLERGVVFQELLIKLESLGYEAVPLIIPAVAVNAPHRRDRVWIVANRTGGQRIERLPIRETQTRLGEQNQRHEWEQDWIEIATELCSLDDGLPIELGEFKLSKAGHRVQQLKALGNAIVPQVAIEIMKAIKYAN